MTSDVELAICISSLVKCLLRSLVHFLIGLFSYLLSFNSFSYILDNNPVSDVSFANIFFQSVACLIILLILSTSERKLYILIVYLINYFFHV